MIWGPTGVTAAVLAVVAAVLAATVAPGAINAAAGLGLGAAVCFLFWFIDER